MTKIRKALFPVGGLGTRFLPATKAMPKEMLPLVDKPLIQYAVEEARAAGIEEFIFVTGRGKTAIEDHFDESVELQEFLKARGKTVELDALSHLSFAPGSISYTRQQEPLGLGHAVWTARHLIGDEPFAVLLADDFIHGQTPCLAQMVKAYNAYQSQGSKINLVALMDVPPSQTHRYGIIDPLPLDGSDSMVPVRGVVEKPSAGKNPSNLAIIGRYILNAEIFKILDRQAKGVGGEIQLTDAFTPMLETQKFYGYRFEGTRYDCGSKAGYVAAGIALALERPDLREELLDLLPPELQFKKVV